MSHTKRPRDPLHSVQCPRCRRVFKSPVSNCWYKRQWWRSKGFPQLHCWHCIRAIERGLDAEKPGEGEIPPYQQPV